MKIECTVEELKELVRINKEPVQIRCNGLTVKGLTNISHKEVSNMSLDSRATKDLTEELSKRTGVQHLWIKPYETVEVKIQDTKQDLHINEGPARILVIYD